MKIKSNDLIEYLISHSNPDIETVKDFISNGIDVNAKDSFCYTALMWVSYHGDTNIAKLLIENGADVNMSDEYNRTALTLSISEANVDIVVLLLSYGADINVKQNNGETPIDIAKKKTESYSKEKREKYQQILEYIEDAKLQQQILQTNDTENFSL